MTNGRVWKCRKSLYAWRRFFRPQRSSRCRWKCFARPLSSTLWPLNAFRRLGYEWAKPDDNRFYERRDSGWLGARRDECIFRFFLYFFRDYKKTTWAYVRRTKDRVIHNVFIIYFFFSKSFMTECVVAPQQYDERALCHIKILIPYKYLPRDKYAHVLSGRKLEDGSV